MIKSFLISLHPFSFSIFLDLSCLSLSSSQPSFLLASYGVGGSSLCRGDAGGCVEPKAVTALASALVGGWGGRLRRQEIWGKARACRCIGSEAAPAPTGARGGGCTAWRWRSRRRLRRRVRRPNLPSSSSPEGDMRREAHWVKNEAG